MKFERVITHEEGLEEWKKEQEEKKKILDEKYDRYKKLKAEAIELLICVIGIEKVIEQLPKENQEEILELRKELQKANYIQ